MAYQNQDDSNGHKHHNIHLTSDPRDAWGCEICGPKCLCKNIPDPEGVGGPASEFGIQPLAFFDQFNARPANAQPSLTARWSSAGSVNSTSDGPAISTEGPGPAGPAGPAFTRRVDGLLIVAAEAWSERKRLVSFLRTATKRRLVAGELFQPSQSETESSSILRAKAQQPPTGRLDPTGSVFQTAGEQTFLTTGPGPVGLAFASKFGGSSTVDTEPDSEVGHLVLTTPSAAAEREPTTGHRVSVSLPTNRVSSVFTTEADSSAEHPTRAASPTPTAASKKLFCNICNKAGHVAAYCWSTNPCKRCQKFGHDARHCFQQLDPQQGTMGRNRYCDYCKQHGHTEHHCYELHSCSLCDKKGHTADRCYNFCRRCQVKGHNVRDCAREWR